MSKAEKNTGEALIKEMIKETHNHVQVTRDDDVIAEYVDIKGHQLHGPYIIVQMKDDTQYVYHMGSVKLLKIWTTKE